MRDLDGTDFDLIALLQNDARTPNKELARRVNLAPSTCLGRVRHLQDRGVFEGFHARVDPAVLGIGLQALVQVRLDRHTRDVVEAFQAHVHDLEEVVSYWHVSGATDFLVHVVVRDADHLRDFAMDAFTTWPHIAHLETSMVFHHAVKPRWPNLEPTEG